MGNEKIMNSRLQQKHDIEANWLKAVNFIPKEGEIIVYDAETADTDFTGTGRGLPITYVRIKVGNGVDNVNDLPFLHGVGVATAEGGEIFNDYVNNQAGLEGRSEGVFSIAGWRSHAEGYLTEATGGGTSHAEGRVTKATGKGSHAEGSETYIDAPGVDNLPVLVDSFHIDDKQVTIVSGWQDDSLQVGDTVAFRPTSDDAGFKTTDAKKIVGIENNGSEYKFVSYYSQEDTITYYKDYDIETGQFATEVQGWGPGWVLVYPTVYPGWEGNEGWQEPESLIYNTISFNGQTYKITGNRMDRFGEDSDAGGSALLCEVTYNSDAIIDGPFEIGNMESNSIITLTLHDSFRANNYYEGYNCPEDGIIPAGAQVRLAIGTSATAEAAHAEGTGTHASAMRAHAEGYRTEASGKNSHSEGYKTQATGESAHVEGNSSNASGINAHAEGLQTSAQTTATHAEGYLTQAGDSSTSSDTSCAHAEGNKSKAISLAAHAEGRSTTASGKSAHAEGQSTVASGENAHAEGKNAVASGLYSHSEGYSTEATGSAAHAEGGSSKATNETAHAEGQTTVASGKASHAEGNNTQAIGAASHAEGYHTIAQSNYSHVQGKWNEPGNYAHIVGGGDSENDRKNIHTVDWDGNAVYAGKVTVGAEGTDDMDLVTYGQLKDYVEDNSIGKKGTGYNAEIFNSSSNKASGPYSHAEGSATNAIGGWGAHAEGGNTKALGISSHAEGSGTSAGCYATSKNGEYINLDGTVVNDKSEAAILGDYSHAEGHNTIAEGTASHAEGEGTIATADNQHVQGQYNIKDKFYIGNGAGYNYIHIVGNGTSDTNRSNAHTIDWQGNAWFTGDVYVGSASGKNRDEGSKRLATEEYVNDKVAEIVPEDKEVYTYTVYDNDLETGEIDYNLIESKWPKICINVCHISGIDENKLFVPCKKEQVQVTEEMEQPMYIFKSGDTTLQIIRFYNSCESYTLSPMFKTNPEGTGSFSLNRKADTTIGDYSAAIGNNATASGRASLAEGLQTTALGAADHAEGYNTIANGGSTGCAHAEGHSTQALTAYSHAEGQGTITSASLSGQHVQGKWNNPNDVEGYAHIVGWGTKNNPKNIHTLDTNGNAWFAGDVFIGNENNKLITAPTNAAAGDLLMYNGTEWVSLSKADLIAEIIAALPSAEEASF